MKTMKYLAGLLAIVLISSAGFAQTERQVERIKSHSNVKKLKSLSQKYERFYQKGKTKAYEYALANGLPVVKELKSGNKAYLMGMASGGHLLYRTVDNVDAAITAGTTSLYPGGGLNLQLEGEDMLVGVWDGGKVRATHQLLSGKITQMDNASQLDNHATHVTGTVVGKELSGSAFEARGMAYKADAHTYFFGGGGNPVSQVASEISQNGLLVSNHSYGLRAEDVPNFYFGYYDYTSANTDNILYNAPYHTLVAAAGNDRTSNGSAGYNLLTAQYTTAKNTVVVAAVNKVLNYTGPSSVTMSNFSSWGPTNDRRVKPDISADGVQVYSSLASSDLTYGNLSGTSMASPSTAGSLILLQELASDLTGDFIRSATIKALVIQTAREAGNYPGPDPSYGWGLLNMEGAAQLMVDSSNDAGPFYAELTLDNNDTYTKTVEASGNEDLKVTIAWTDPAASAQGENDTSRRLINDLDMRITDSNGNEYFPYRLHSFINGNAALKDGDNNVDNVEQVVVADAVEGENYTITITHKGSLDGGSQDYSIAATGNETMGVDNQKLSGSKIYPNPATDQFNLSLEKSSNKVDVTIFDINGKKVMDKTFNGSSNFDRAVDIANLTSGVYFVKINADGKTANQKLIVK